MIKPTLLNPTDFHLFYYPWYGNVITDGAYRHWNNNGHNPAVNDDICSDYFPVQDIYSARDTTLLTTQMENIVRSGCGTIILSWWGQGSWEDDSVDAILTAAANAGIKVGFKIERYAGRDINSVVSDIAYIYTNYGSHSAFYKTSKPNKWGVSTGERGVFYIYASTDFANADWITALDALRGTANDGIFLCNQDPENQLDASLVAAGHFDGYYSYDILNNNGSLFATCGATLKENNELWSPSVGPGWVAVRNGNAGNIPRIDGQRLNDFFGLAYQSSPSFISITSFNEWHEGSMIEPAAKKSITGYDYKNFEGAYGKIGEAAQFAYIDEVEFWVSKRSRRLA